MNEENIIKSAYDNINLPETDLREAVKSRIEAPKRKNRVRLRPAIIFIALLIALTTIVVIAAPIDQIIEQITDYYAKYIGATKVEEIENGVKYTVPNEKYNNPLSDVLREFFADEANKPSSTFEDAYGEVREHYSKTFNSIHEAETFFGIKILENTALNQTDKTLGSVTITKTLNSEILTIDSGTFKLVSVNIPYKWKKDFNLQSYDIDYSIGITYSDSEETDVYYITRKEREFAPENINEPYVSVLVPIDEPEIYISPTNGIEAQLAILLDEGTPITMINIIANFTHDNLNYHLHVLYRVYYYGDIVFPNKESEIDNEEIEEIKDYFKTIIDGFIIE